MLREPGRGLETDNAHCESEPSKMSARISSLIFWSARKCFVQYFYNETAESHSILSGFVHQLPVFIRKTFFVLPPLGRHRLNMNFSYGTFELEYFSRVSLKFVNIEQPPPQSSVRCSRLARVGASGG